MQSANDSAIASLGAVPAGRSSANCAARRRAGAGRQRRRARGALPTSDPLAATIHVALSDRPAVTSHAGGDPDQTAAILEHAFAVVDPDNAALDVQLIGLHHDHDGPDTARRTFAALVTISPGGDRQVGSRAGRGAVRSRTPARGARGAR